MWIKHDVPKQAWLHAVWSRLGMCMCIYIHTSSVKKSKHLEPVGNQKQRVSEPTHCTLYLYTYIFTYIAYIHVLDTTRHIHSLSYITILHITIYYRIDLYKLYILCIYIYRDSWILGISRICSTVLSPWLDPQELSPESWSQPA